MAFNKADIYTSSGSVKLFNTWTPYVSKFDTSSFYNWEQDNLPLYDLEERTYEMWEQGGFPTSSLTGIALTVSADTPQATLDADPNIFTSLSSCIAAIPKVVRCPVLVEVANFGDLGNLELHNFRIEEGGSIEIINRNFGRAYNVSSDVQSVIAAGDVNYNETHRMIASISSLDLSTSLTNASAVHIVTPVFSAVNDTRLTEHNSFLYPKHTLRRSALNASIKYTSFYDTPTDEFVIGPYEEYLSVGTDGTTATHDVSATNQYTGTAIQRFGAANADSIGGKQSR